MAYRWQWSRRTGSSQNKMVNIQGDKTRLFALKHVTNELQLRVVKHLLSIPCYSFAINALQNQFGSTQVYVKVRNNAPAPSQARSCDIEGSWTPRDSHVEWLIQSQADRCLRVKTSTSINIEPVKKNTNKCAWETRNINNQHLWHYGKR